MSVIIMAFRYINPGYGLLLDSDCTATQFTDTTYSRTGVAFSQTSYSKGITISNFAQGDEFWAKFDWYLPASTPTPQNSYNLYCSAPTTNHYGLRIYIQNLKNACNIMANGTSKEFTDGQFSNSGLSLGAINRILFHLVFGDASTAYMECTINNVQLPRVTGNAINWQAGYSSGTVLTKVAELFTWSRTPISNVILSDQKISINEDVVALPIFATDTNMTAGDNGLYIANAANQSILSSVDITSLAETYGANSQVTGIEVVGNPAYKTAAGMTTLTSLSKTGGVVTEHDTAHLSDDTESMIQSAWALSNTTIADLQNMQFGWKAGE